jgi:hypothetical protein
MDCNTNTQIIPNGTTYQFDSILFNSTQQIFIEYILSTKFFARAWGKMKMNTFSTMEVFLIKANENKHTNNSNAR